MFRRRLILSNDTGYTALALATKNGDVKIMKELIKFGADCNTMNNASHSNVFLACFNNQLKALKVLTENGADINVPDQRGWTPLMIAVNNNFPDIIEYLIDHGANVDQKDKFGKKAVDRATTDQIFFMLTNCSMEERIKESMSINDDNRFRSKSPKFLNSEKKNKTKAFRNIKVNDLNSDLETVELGPRTTRKHIRSSHQLPSDVTSHETEIVDEVLRKNLNKLKKQVSQLTNKGVEENVMNEILDGKAKTMLKIKESMNKMSKKMLK